MTNKQFAQKYGAMAQQVTKGTGIFPETLLTQAILESGNGQTELAKKYNNFFGVKAFESWKGKRVTLLTPEVVKGVKGMYLKEFRVYDSPIDSFRDYVKVITKVKNYKDALTKKTYQEQLTSIAGSGYATATKYKESLLAVAKNVSAGLTNVVSKVAPKSDSSILILLVVFAVILILTINI